MASIRFVSPQGYDAVEFAFYPRCVYMRRLIRDNIHRDEWGQTSSKKITMQQKTLEVINLQQKGWKPG